MASKSGPWQSVVSVWWMRVDIDSALSLISAFLTDLKEFKLHTVYSGTSEQIKPWQPVDKAAEFKFESKCDSLQAIWQSLPKAIPEDNRRLWLQNQRSSSWGSAPAQLGLGSGPRYMICVLLRRLRESENTRTCENCTRNACNLRMSVQKRATKSDTSGHWAGRTARSNTGRFRVGCSRCWPRPARLRKTCYHSCDTDSVGE